MLESNASAPDMDPEPPFIPHTSHWGVFSARMKDGELEVQPYAGDPDPNEIIQNFPAALRHRARVAQPMVRRGWLENGPGPDDRRGRSGRQADESLCDDSTRCLVTTGHRVCFAARVLESGPAVFGQIAPKAVDRNIARE